MIGGDSSFGLGGYADSPLAPVMPVTMKPPQHKEKKRALVLIIDKSGSMGRNDKLTYAKAAAETVTRSLKDNDLIGVIGFDSQPFVVIPLQSVGQSRAVFQSDDRSALGARPDFPDSRTARGRTHARQQRRAGQARRDPDRRRDRRHAPRCTTTSSRGCIMMPTRPSRRSRSARTPTSICCRRSRSTAAVRTIKPTARAICRSFSSRISRRTAATSRWSKKNSRRAPKAPTRF